MVSPRLFAEMLPLKSVSPQYEVFPASVEALFGWIQAGVD